MLVYMFLPELFAAIFFTIKAGSLVNALNLKTKIKALCLAVGLQVIVSLVYFKIYQNPEYGFLAMFATAVVVTGFAALLAAIFSSLQSANLKLMGASLMYFSLLTLPVLHIIKAIIYS